MKTKKAKPTPPHTIGTADLCAVTGYTARRLRDLAKAGLYPPPEHGRYELLPVFKGIVQHFRDLLAKQSSAEKAERLAFWKAKRKREEAAMEKELDLQIPKAVVGPALRNLALNQRAVLQRKLEQEMPARVVGRTTNEVMQEGKDIVDEVCKLFLDGTRQWMEEPPKSNEDQK